MRWKSDDARAHKTGSDANADPRRMAGGVARGRKSRGPQDRLAITAPAEGGKREDQRALGGFCGRGEGEGERGEGEDGGGEKRADGERRRERSTAACGEGGV